MAGCYNPQMLRLAAVERSQKVEKPVRDEGLEGEAADSEELRELPAGIAIGEGYLRIGEVVCFCRSRKAQAEDHQKTF